MSNGGFCGWVALHAASDPQEILEQMAKAAGRRTGSEGAPRVHVRTNAGLCAPDSATHGNIWAAVDGQPRWLDEQVAALARTQGHARALIHAYEATGDALLQNVRGSFALAVLDLENRRALLAVDRMGTRPLAFATLADGTLAFAGNAGAVAKHPAIASRIDPQAIFNYTFFHMVPSPQTIYAGVQKLEPAQCLTWHSGRHALQRYWTPRFSVERGGDETALASELKERLRSAIARCEPDNTTGAFLSGGLDSSTVTGMFAQTAQHPVRTYSIGFNQSGYDELGYARISASHFGVQPREYYLQHHDVESAIPEIAAAYDEPFGNSSAAPTLLCARMARRDGMTALLAGDGGDEIFGGNERYARQQLFDVYWRIPRLLRTGALEPLFLSRPLRGMPLIRKASSFVDQARVPMPLRLQTYNFLYRTAASELFEPALLRQVDVEQPRRLLEQTWNEAPTESLVDRMLYLDWKFTLADNDLRKVNRMCELAGIRVHYPLLDDELVEFSTRLPPRWKVHRGTLRYFYKRALTGFLPDAVIAKTKQGFGLPFGEWLKQSPPLQASVYRSLEALKRRSILQPVFIDRLIREHRDGHAAYFGTMVWVLVMLEQWLAHHAAEDAIAL